MCSDTKGRIAEAVEQMLQTKPVCKITVQSVMEQTQMKRQSFYYHYQDIYNVLEWIVETEVCTPLQFDDAQAPGEWCLQALTLLREKQQLMRKISQALGQDTMYRITERTNIYSIWRVAISLNALSLNRRARIKAALALPMTTAWNPLNW